MCFLFERSCTFVCGFYGCKFVRLWVSAVSLPVDGRVAGRAWGIFPSELLRGRVASSSPPCWTNNKAEGYVPRSQFIYDLTPHAQHSLCEHKSVTIWSNRGWNTCILGPWRTLRAWRSVGVAAGVAVRVAAGAGQWLNGATTGNDAVETQLGFRPWRRPPFQLQRCGSFYFVAQPPHRCGHLGSGRQCSGPTAVLHR